jgi:hypothetical protein
MVELRRSLIFPKGHPVVTSSVDADPKAFSEAARLRAKGTSLSVCIRLRHIVKLDFRSDLRRRGPERVGEEAIRAFSHGQFEPTTRGIAAILRDFRLYPADSLCNSDGLAVCAGFEPSIQFLALPLKAHVSLLSDDCIWKPAEREKRR